MTSMVKTGAIQSFLARVRRAVRAFESERTEDSATWTFRVHLERDELDGGWVAECIDLPGAVSEGETQAEALRNLTEAISEVIAVRMGERVPELEPEDDAPDRRDLALSV
jgi:predicted RNase H-like HicB family nuclease